MKKSYDKYDLQFKKLIDNSGLDSPSKDFTSNLMQKIEQEQMANEEIAPVKAFSGNWLLIVLIIVVFAVGFFVIDYFNITLISDNVKPIITPLFQGIFNSFKDIFASVSVSSTTVAIIFGFIGLVVIERILNKLKFTRNIYFSF